MMDASGGNVKSYKSACNLFYISEKISSQCNSMKLPIFSHQSPNMRRFKLSEQTIEQIKKENTYYRECA